VRTSDKPDLSLRYAPIFGLLLLALAVAAYFVVPARPYLPWAVGVGGLIMLYVAQRASTVADRRDREASQSQARAELLEKQLQRQREVIDALVDGLDIAMFICDGDGAVQYANKKAREMFRFPSPNGRTVLAVTLSYDLERLIAEANSTKLPQAAELAFRYPEERVGMARAWLESPDSDRVFLSVYDVTDLRRLERVRTDFVANVSHELRTPLTNVRAMAETLLESDDPDTRKRYLESIVAEVDRLTLLSQDLLTLSTTELGPISRSLCDLVELAGNVIHQLGAQAKKKGLAITLDAPKKLTVNANAEQMLQVLLNLLDNAIKYTNEGSITVGIAQEGPDAVIRVSDTGIGIASEHLPRMFERFYRVDKSRSRETGGTGLGLSIVKHIVEGHGGKVAVESALGHGSTFTAHVPVGVKVEPGPTEPGPAP
jgi:two-component system phosphate regulon sensor histidine kinase PhoR